MKLTYRGISYDYNPPMLEVTESDIAMQYRGQSVAYTYVRHVPIPQPAERLTYRGAAYQTTRRGQVLPADVQLTGNGQLASQGSLGANLGSRLSNLRDKLIGTSPAAQARRDLLQLSSQQHKESMARSLQHRIDVAKEQGNAVLIQQLESEMSQTV